MKKTLLTLALAALVIAPALAQNPKRGARPQRGQVPNIEQFQGVGPAISGSTDFRSLPENAQTFIESLFPRTTVTKVENNFAKNIYEVDMSDGYEITFNREGQWLQVEAPDGATLPSSTLQALVPEQKVRDTLASDQLLKGGVTEAVEEITFFPEGYMVEYVTGTVGTGKAAVSKADGSVMQRPSKATRGPKAKMVRGGKKGQKGPRTMRKGQPAPARMVKYTPAQAAKAQDGREQVF